MVIQSYSWGWEEVICLVMSFSIYYVAYEIGRVESEKYLGVTFDRSL